MSGVFANGANFALGSTTVSELTNISFPNISADSIDVTTHNNTDKFREFIKGLSDGGEITIEGNMDYTDYNTIYVASVTTSIYSATVTVPTSPSESQWLANVFVTGLEGDAPVEDKINFNATLKVTGKPTFQKV